MEETKKAQQALVDLAVEGDAEALQKLISEIQDKVFNLSLRMLGTIPDAEDASQDILVKVMTSLSTFRKESQLNTWVYRIAVNYLLELQEIYVFAPAA